MESGDKLPQTDAKAVRKTTPLWYYLTIFVWPIGGLITFFALRTKDPTKARKCLIITLIFLAVLVAIYGSFLISFGTVNPLYIVSTGSMIPSLNIFDVIVVQEHVSFDQLQIGDIIAYYRPDGHDKLIVHRVAEILNKDPLVIRAKGDANPGSIPGTDFPITHGDYVGKITYVIPQIGYLTRLLAPPIHYVIALVIVGIAYTHHQTYRRELAKEQNTLGS